MRALWAVVAVACVGVVVWMFFLLRDNVVYLDPVSEAVADRADGHTRVGGSVVPGTIDERDGGVAFDMTEGGAVMRVDYDGAPPQLFEACAPVVVEGEWEGDIFESDRLLIRHGNEYEPPEGADRASSECPDEDAE